MLISFVYLTYHMKISRHFYFAKFCRTLIVTTINLLVARIFPRPCGARKNTTQLVKYPRVLSVKPSNKVYVLFAGLAVLCYDLKRASHDKQMLVNSCWQTQIGVRERHNNMFANCWSEIELVSIHFFPATCRCVLHTHTNCWPTRLT